MAPVLQVVQRVTTRSLLKQAGVKADVADNGLVTFTQFADVRVRPGSLAPRGNVEHKDPSQTFD